MIMVRNSPKCDCVKVMGPVREVRTGQIGPNLRSQNTYFCQTILSNYGSHVNMIIITRKVISNMSGPVPNGNRRNAELWRRSSCDRLLRRQTGRKNLTFSAYIVRKIDQNCRTVSHTVRPDGGQSSPYGVAYLQRGFRFTESGKNARKS